MSKVAVTGASGFIGSHVLKKLIERGYNIKAISRTHKKGYFIICDFFDKRRLQAALNGCDSLIHLAAKVPEIGEHENYDEAYKANVQATKNLLDAAIKAGLTKFIYISGWHVYHQNSPSPINEKEKLGPTTIYAKTKAMGEKMVLAEKRIPSIVLRIGNVYGPAPSQDGVVMHMIKNVSAGNTLKVFGPLRARDYLYVEDVAKGILDAVEAKATGIFNMGSGRPTTIREITNIVINFYRKFGLKVRKPEITGESVRDSRYLDIAKAEKYLSFRPATSLQKGVEKTAIWWENHSSPKVVLFDVDGTLLDVRKRYCLGYKLAAQKMGLHLASNKKILTLKRNGMRGIDVLKILYPKERPITLRKMDELRIRKTNSENLMTFDTPFNGATTALDKIRSKGLIVILITKRPKEFNTQLKKTGLVRKNDFILNVKRAEDKKKWYSKAAKISGVTPFRCVAIGDSPEDIRTAKSLGMKTVAAVYGLTGRKKMDQEYPDLLLHCVRDLPTIFRHFKNGIAS